MKGAEEGRSRRSDGRDRGTCQHATDASSSEFAVPTDLDPQAHASSSNTVVHPAPLFVDEPRVGDTFLGFQLIEVLGRGAFGTVYLARQGKLADRFVALKISPPLDTEPRLLAQLQHTNIVPIYSIHRAKSFQAICMPYYGMTTLKTVWKSLRSQVALPETGLGLISSLIESRFDWDSQPICRPEDPADQEKQDLPMSGIDAEAHRCTRNPPPRR